MKATVALEREEDQEGATVEDHTGRPEDPGAHGEDHAERPGDPEAAVDGEDCAEQPSDPGDPAWCERFERCGDCPAVGYCREHGLTCCAATCLECLAREDCKAQQEHEPESCPTCSSFNSSRCYHCKFYGSLHAGPQAAKPTYEPIDEDEISVPF